jgi:hypothetical protein
MLAVEVSRETWFSNGRSDRQILLCPCPDPKAADSLQDGYQF